MHDFLLVVKVLKDVWKYIHFVEFVAIRVGMMFIFNVDIAPHII